jgi:hypothetical protein
LTLAVEDHVRHVHLGRGTAGAVRDVVVLDCSEHPTWHDLADAVKAPRVGEVYRLVYLRRADDLDEALWADLTDWAVRRFSIPRTYICASGEVIWNPKDGNDPRHSLFEASPRGAYIRCGELNREQQARYIERRFGLPRDDAVALYMVDRVGGDVSRLKTEADKLTYLIPEGERLAQGHVQAYVQKSPSQAFVEALVVNRKPEAITAAAQVLSARFVLGSLEWHLQSIYRVREGIRILGRKARVVDIASKTGLNEYVVHKLRPLARSYDLSVVRSRYRAILKAYRMVNTVRTPEDVLLPLIVRW